MSVKLPAGSKAFNGYRKLHNVLVPVSLLPIPNETISPIGKLLYGWLRFVAKDTDRCKVVIDEIAERFGVSSATIMRALGQLAKTGLIYRHRLRYGLLIVFLESDLLLKSFPKAQRPKPASDLTGNHSSDTSGMQHLADNSDIPPPQHLEPDFGEPRSIKDELQMLQPCPPDIAGWPHPYKEDLGVSLRNKSLRNKAAASETLSSNSEFGGQPAAAAVLADFQSENDPPLDPEVLAAPGAENPAAHAAGLDAIRQALAKAGVKILKPKHLAEMLELAKSQGLNVQGLELFIEWKGAKAETSSLILRALRDDIAAFEKSPQGRQVWIVTRLIEHRFAEQYTPQPEVDRSPKFFKSATRCGREECRGTLWYKLGGVGAAMCAFCMKPDSSDVLAIAVELGADTPIGVCRKCNGEGYIEKDRETASVRAEWCDCGHAEILRQASPGKVERATRELLDWFNWAQGKNQELLYGRKTV